IQSRSYENQEGRRIFVTEVVCDSVQFLEPKNAQHGGQRSQNNNFQDYGQGFGGQQSGQNTSYNNNNSSNSNQSDNPFANANGPIDISDDDLPF
ncbi:MAG: single-stranded DNA-binding protein, partial [Staphylococcus epidermidis]|nr:single-stranded DNA-binding protein [Staphylococcus epidermidis]